MSAMEIAPERTEIETREEKTSGSGGVVAGADGDGSVFEQKSAAGPEDVIDEEDVGSGFMALDEDVDDLEDVDYLKGNPKAPSFVLPSNLPHNSSGWGPTVEAIPVQLRNLPFTFFKKNGQIAKASDWNSKNSYGRSRYRQDESNLGHESLQFVESEVGFDTVDNTKKVTTGRGGHKKRWQNRQHNQKNQTRGQRHGKNTMPRRQRNKRYYHDRRYRNRHYDQQEKELPPSVEIKENWELKETFTFEDLAKCRIDSSIYEKADDLRMCGSLPLYEKNKYDRIIARKPVRLKQSKVHYITETTSGDPILQELRAQKAGNVYLTDSIMALLMTCPSRSVYGWDVVVTKRGEELVFDTRPLSKINYVTVNETGQDPKDKPEEGSINHPANLSKEASVINVHFADQVVNQKSLLNYQEENPYSRRLEGSQRAATVGYKYRRWNLSSNIVVVARTELNGYLQTASGKNSLLAIKALNEFDRTISGGQEWRQKIDTQFSSILQNEIRNNRFKFARWVAEALLAGADEMKLGCVSRSQRLDAHNHVILAVRKETPRNLAQQLEVSGRNMWGVLNHLIERCLEQPDGKYLIFKNPNKTELSLYSIPNDAFNHEQGEA